MPMHPLSYQIDGETFLNEMFVPETAAEPRLAIIVFPDAFGIAEHARHQAARLCELGYPVLACDLHGGAKRLSQLSDVLDFVGQVRADPSVIRARALKALEATMAFTGLWVDRIATVGYCLGGTMGLELAREGVPVGATIGLHCGLGTGRPATGPIAGKVLVLLGADDPVVPVEERQQFEAEMRSVQADWQLHLFGGVVHSFTDPAVDALGQPHITKYDAVADARSWDAIKGAIAEMGRG